MYFCACRVNLYLKNILKREHLIENNNFIHKTKSNYNIYVLCSWKSCHCGHYFPLKLCGYANVARNGT